MPKRHRFGGERGLLPGWVGLRGRGGGGGGRQTDVQEKKS